MDDPRFDRLRRAIARAEGVACGEPLRLDRLDDADLERMARDRTEPAGRRLTALAAFVERNRAEKAAGDLVLALLDDPDEAVALGAIERALPFDARARNRLRAMMADPRPSFRDEATRALARRKDRAIIPALLAWASGDDPSRAAMARECLEFVLYPEEWQSLRGGFDDADESS